MSTIAAKIPQEKKDKVEELAKKDGLNKNKLLKQLMDDYIESKEIRNSLSDEEEGSAKDEPEEEGSAKDEPEEDEPVDFWEWIGLEEENSDKVESEDSPVSSDKSDSLSGSESKNTIDMEDKELVERTTLKKILKIVMDFKPSDVSPADIKSYPCPNDDCDFVANGVWYECPNCGQGIERWEE